MLRVAFVLVCLLVSALPVRAEFTRADPARIHMVVFRGCEEACRGFIKHLTDRDLPVTVEVTDVDRDSSLLPEVRARLIAERPDLVVTWGTSVSVGIIGTMEEYGEGTALGDIPALFMIVADPVSSDLIDSYRDTGRPTVTGVRNRVPEVTQLGLLFEYHFPKRLGVINNPKELNSTLNTEVLRELADEMGFELVEREYTLNDAGEADPEEIPALMAAMRADGVDTIYVGSSSFNLDNRDVFTAAAVAEGLPVFSAYAQMVTESDAVMAVANSYVNVGKLAAGQAARILLDGIVPGDLPVAALDRYSVYVNMRIAKKLKLFPPIQLITLAEIVE